MERLEAALEKAREQRQTAVPIEPSKDAPAPRKSKPDDVWQELHEFKLSARLARSNRITTLTNNALSGPYDMLRSRVMRIMQENNWKRLAITSPNIACGKTTVTTNLAISLARQEDIKILVLDMDMRRPALSKILGQKFRDSLFDVLTGKVEPRDQFLRFNDNLAFALNFKAASKPSELLQSKQTVERLAEIEETYKPDLMIFDMPPMLGADDYVGFMKNVDCGLLISAAGETSVTHLDVCEKELAELTNVLGVVLNKCRHMESENGYDYDYY